MADLRTLSGELLSPEEQARLRASRACVIGCGGLGGYLVELLAHRERLLHRGLGGGDRLRERPGAFLAELVESQRQLVGAGAHRIVDADHLLARQRVEGVHRHAGQQTVNRTGLHGRQDLAQGH